MVEIKDESGVVLLTVDADSLENQNLSNANLRSANLEGANLSGANLREADLRNANLRFAVLRDAKLDDARMRSASLCGADLTGAAALGADLTFANLEFANLTRADLRRSTLTNCELTGTTLRETDLRGASLRGCRFPPKMQSTNLADADLREAWFVDCDLTSVRLYGAKMGAARFSRRTKWPSALSMIRTGGWPVFGFGAFSGPVFLLLIGVLIAAVQQAVGAIFPLDDGRFLIFVLIGGPIIGAVMAPVTWIAVNWLIFRRSVCSHIWDETTALNEIHVAFVVEQLPYDVEASDLKPILDAYRDRAK
jgi:uncharacterized protein YjbI with pentapeptide repeats